MWAIYGALSRKSIGRHGSGQQEEQEVLSLELDTAPLLLFTLPILLTGIGAVLGQLAAQSKTLAVRKASSSSRTSLIITSCAYQWFNQWDFWSWSRRREQRHCCRHRRFILFPFSVLLSYDKISAQGNVHTL